MPPHPAAVLLFFAQSLLKILKRHRASHLILNETLTFLSRLLVPDEWRAFRKPAVVDQRVGFFLDGGSSARTRDSPPPPPNGPLRVSRAGSLLRRTWRGISAGQTAAVHQLPFTSPPPRLRY